MPGFGWAWNSWSGGSQARSGQALSRSYEGARQHHVACAGPPVQSLPSATEETNPRAASSSILEPPEVREGLEREEHGMRAFWPDWLPRAPARPRCPRSFSPAAAPWGLETPPLPASRAARATAPTEGTRAPLFQLRGARTELRPGLGPAPAPRAQRRGNRSHREAEPRSAHSPPEPESRARLRDRLTYRRARRSGARRRMREREGGGAMAEQSETRISVPLQNSERWLQDSCVLGK